MDNITSPSTCGYSTVFIYSGVPISVFVIFESIVTILTIWRSQALHTNQYLYIASLAVSDILLAMSLLATVVTRSTWINFIPDQQHTLNNILYGMTFSTIVLTGCHMSIIAVDRYIRIAHPFYYIQNITKTRIIKVLSFAYMVCAVNASIPAFVYQDNKYHKHCISIHQPAEYFYSNASVIFLNIIVVIICYFKIALVAINHKKAALSRRMQTQELEAEVINQNNRSAMLKSVRFFVAMCGAFFGLSVPPFVTDIIASYYSLPDYIITIGVFFFPLHSATNFVICCSMNQSFSNALKMAFVDMKVFCFRRCLRHS